MHQTAGSAATLRASLLAPLVMHVVRRRKGATASLMRRQSADILTENKEK